MTIMRTCIHFLKEIPAWAVLSMLFGCLLIGYYIRPDNVTEDSLKAVLGALLLTLRPNERSQPPPPPGTPPPGPTSALPEHHE